MKKTLLELVQNILSSMDSDEVNSISDTVESVQVAKLVQEVFENIIARANLPENYIIYQLEASGDPAIPIKMTIPSNVDNTLWIKYNKVKVDETNPSWQEVRWMEPTEFLSLVQSFAPSDDNVETCTITYRGNSIPFYYQTDKAPDYYSTFDDRILLFDSLDTEVDTTLQKSKSQAYGVSFPVWTMSDSYIPDLDAQQFPLLYQEAKALAFAELKQMVHARAEKESRRQWVSSQHNKIDGVARVPYRDTLANYGRR